MGELGFEPMLASLTPPVPPHPNLFYRTARHPGVITLLLTVNGIVPFYLVLFSMTSHRQCISKHSEMESLIQMLNVILKVGFIYSCF